MVDFFLGPRDWDGRRPSDARAAAEEAGLRVAAYRVRLAELHELITTEGPFAAHSSRFLIEARKPE